MQGGKKRHRRKGSKEDRTAEGLVALMASILYSPGEGQPSRKMLGPATERLDEKFRKVTVPILYLTPVEYLRGETGDRSSQESKHRNTGTDQ